jgi:SAM-dependent methyltransferase
VLEGRWNCREPQNTAEWFKEQNPDVCRFTRNSEDCSFSAVFCGPLRFHRPRDAMPNTKPRTATELFDKAYFDRWYRSPRRRVLDATEIRRRATLVVAVAEYILERPVRSALDVGSGEGNWRAPLRRLRPGMRYVGVDPSEYVVRTFGHRRNIRAGSAESLHRLGLRGPFDIVIASGVLNFLALHDLRRALRTMAGLVDGVAFLELFAARDDVVGDTRGWEPLSAARYRSLLRTAGFVSCGPHCYVTRKRASTLAALERAG